MTSMADIALHALMPDILIALAAMGLLLFGVLSKRDHALACTVTAVIVFVVAARFILAAPAGAIFGGLFLTDDFTRYADMLVLLGSSGALILSVDFNRREAIGRFEFPVLVMFSTLGMLVMVSAGNMMTLYLGLELQSLALYVVAAFARDDLRSTEAGLKYFILSALASGLLLYGISLVYGFSGTTDFAGLAHALASSARANDGALVGIVFVIVGLAFKLSAAPFHMWTPDVYEGAPTPVTSLFSTAPKMAAMALLLRLLMGPFAPLLSQWQMLIEIIAIASMLLGALGAIGQLNIKRLMAYSSISHMGYALIGLAAGTEAGVSATLVYMAIYTVMSLGVFGCIIAMRRGGKQVELISDLAGLDRRNRGLALALAALMLALAGIPPLSGFWGKLYVFYAAVQSGLYGLAVVGVLTSVVAAFYYLRVIKVMYFDEAAPSFDYHSKAVGLMIAGCAVLSALFVFVPGPVSQAASVAAHALLGAG